MRSVDPCGVTIYANSDCDNCGDGCGWHFITLGNERIWSACADCNDDGKKPRPDLCEGCGDTEAFCHCERIWVGGIKNDFEENK